MLILSVPTRQSRQNHKVNRPKKRLMKIKERAASIIQKLEKAYPNAHCELEFETPFQLLVATILSAQCTDKRVNIVTRGLFQKYRTPKDFAEVGQTELENDIKTTGFYRNKAKNLRAMARDLLELYDGEVPRSMSDLDRKSVV